MNSIFHHTAQSPIFTYLSATLNGLTTIRAFEAEETLLREFVTREDTHTACAYMIIVTEAVFWYTLEITCFIFLTCVTFVCVIFDSDNSGAKVGLAITQAMSIAYALQYGIFRTAEATSQSTAVERIIDYRQLKVEDEPKEPIKLQKDWPKKGSIEFKNVFYRYFVAASPVLQDLSFQIKSKEKIGMFEVFVGIKSGNINDAALIRYCGSNRCWKEFIDWRNFPFGFRGR